ncbi:hypothetical protein SmJEL517_g02675 [Synchytrium microbalum]|uniref:Methyltransferase FkbM domain-containing protein n=1 Tax=Synchytrium microbalum TaxID=1806994 RepID=A0A507C5F0_9FUNG|nr:uncharacterized protein SmJEL517_g02675 [Synchytrium microbalum]TPX34711.1 hypothetical protein SmJEL517_g02675 [Synchytrium microbalum]
MARPQTIALQGLGAAALAALLLYLVFPMHFAGTSFGLSASQETLITTHLKFLYNIGDHEIKFYSQNGEDGAIQYIFANLGTTNKYYVEFGVFDGTECNTKWLWENQRWDGLLMDGKAKSYDSRVIHNHFINRTNIVPLFQKYEVPNAFDILSVDLDSSDYWVLKAILTAKYRPRVIIIEINRNFEVDEPYTVNKERVLWTEPASLFGLSPLAVSYLCNKFGYSMIYVDKAVVNGFCVAREVLSDLVRQRTGIVVSPHDLKRFLPTFEYIYRRQGPLAVDSLVRFKKEVLPLDVWNRVDENGDVVIAAEDVKA